MDLTDPTNVAVVEKTTEVEIPEPKRGGTNIFCPHVTAATVKVPRKKAIVVTTPCPFKTRNIRKYRRHWLARHGERS